MSQARGGYETNNLSVLAASILIDNYNEVETYVKEIQKGLNFFKSKLKKLNLKYIGGTFGNYIFVEFSSKNQANLILRKLSLNKIYVRNGWPKPYDNGLLISGANKNTMTKISKVLEKNILNE